MKVEHRFISDLHIGHISVTRFSEDSYKQWPHYVQENEDGSKHSKVQFLSYMASLNMEWAKVVVPSTIEEWHERIRSNWNSVVGDNDETWIVGDTAMKGKSDPAFVWDFLNSLKGKIHLIPGNHDDELLKYMWNEHGGEFVGYWNGKMSAATGIRKPKIIVEPLIVSTHIPMPDGKPAREVFLSHYPTYAFKNCGFGGTHIFGHVHNMLDQNQDFIDSMIKGIWTYREGAEIHAGRAVNVGCMLPWINFVPRTLSELEESFIDKYAGPLSV